MEANWKKALMKMGGHGKMSKVDAKDIEWVEIEEEDNDRHNREV
jgi:hypothetical protein